MGIETALGHDAARQVTALNAGLRNCPKAHRNLYGTQKRANAKQLKTIGDTAKRWPCNLENFDDRMAFQLKEGTTHHGMFQAV